MKMTVEVNKIALWSVILLLISAFGVIYLKDLHRRLFIQYEHLQQQKQQQQIEWSKLLLEQSTLATQVRIQQIAQKQIGMVIPSSGNIMMVQVGARTLAEK